MDDPRNYPEQVVRYEPGRVVKIPAHRVDGTRWVDEEIRVGPFGGYGNRELGVWSWDGWGKLARADQAWAPPSEEDAA